MIPKNIQVRFRILTATNMKKTAFWDIAPSRLEIVALMDPNVAGSKPGQGDGFLRAIKIRSTPSSRMGSKEGRSNVVRFYGM
jgi:hypothetical protein